MRNVLTPQSMTVVYEDNTSVIATLRRREMPSSVSYIISAIDAGHIVRHHS